VYSGWTTHVNGILLAEGLLTAVLYCLSVLYCLFVWIFYNDNCFLLYFSDSMKSLLTDIKEATADLSNQQYFLDTAPEEYCVEGYLISCRGPSAKDESIEKRLQNEWRCKLLPRLKESHHQNLRETGTRLERAWKNEKRRLNELTEIVKDEQTTKKFKRGMKQAFQQQQLTIMEVSSRRLGRDLTDICKAFVDLKAGKCLCLN
jgi:hypothetical protein